MANLIDPNDINALLDAIEAHPLTGLSIWFDLDRMRHHVANRYDRNEDEVSDNEVHELGPTVEWELTFSYADKWGSWEEEEE